MSVDGNNKVTLNDINIENNKIIQTSQIQGLNAAGLGVSGIGEAVLNSGIISNNINIPKDDARVYARAFGGVGVGGDGSEATFIMNGGLITENTGSHGGGVGVGGKEGMPQRRMVRSTFGKVADEDSSSGTVSLNGYPIGDYVPHDTTLKARIQGDGYDEIFEFNYWMNLELPVGNTLLLKLQKKMKTI